MVKAGVWRARARRQRRRSPAGERAGAAAGARGVVAATGAALLAACSTSSQGGGVSLDRLEPSVTLETELRDESFGNGPAVATKELVFRESAGANFEGNVYHPKLVTFGGQLDLGLEQRELDQRGAPTSLRSNRDNSQYDLGATVLKDHPYSLRLFAQRNQVRTRQSFFPTATAIAAREGAMVWAKDWIVPSQLEVARHRFEGLSGDVSREDRDSLNLTGARNTETLDVNYRLFAQQVDSDLAGGRYDEVQAFGGGTWRFGAGNVHSLSIDGLQRKQTGDSQNEYSNVSGTARLALTDQLDSRLGVSTGSSRFGTQSDGSTDRTDVYAELEHRLYESLTTTLRGDQLHQSTGVGELDRTGGSGRLAYRKKTSFGELRVHLLEGRARQQESGLFGARVAVADESHVVSPGSPVVLDNANVEQPNILVTDATSTIVYVTPRDYLVEDFGVRTRLTFPPGSLIVGGQVILVTYTYAPTFDRTFAEQSHAAGLELLFGEVLSARAQWSRLEQQLRAGPADDTLDHATEWGLGLRANLGRHSVSVDYLDHDSELTPYDRTWASWDTWVSLTERLGINLDLSAYQTRFRGDQRDENGLAGVADLHWVPDAQLSVDVRAELRRTDLGTEDGWGAFLDGSIHYRFRMTTVDLSLIESRERWDFSNDRDVTRLLLTVTRRF